MEQRRRGQNLMAEMAIRGLDEDESVAQIEDKR
jgi:hypothetical protein